jgi:hypothetical protein
MTVPVASVEGPSFIVDPASQNGAAANERAIVLSDGRIVVTWQDATGQHGDLSGSAVVAKILNSDGSVPVPDFLVNTATASDQSAPSVAALAGGGFVVT